MNLIKKTLLIFGFLFLQGCSSLDVGYFFHVTRGQMSLLTHRVPVEEALKTYSFNTSEEHNLRLISQIKTFARDVLHLDIDESIYSSYVQIDGPYVTYLLRVSSAYELKAYEWNFPIVGSAPYKGFFNKEKALRAAKAFSKKQYDTYVRGVTAYSTLGWFSDSVLSTMLSYKEHRFVHVILHELVHTVLFFKGHINFNERLAEFVARKAVVLFYLHNKNPQIVQQMLLEWEDELLFSSFMMKEFQSLEQWYQENKGHITKDMKEQRLKEIQNRFLSELSPNLKTDLYDFFPEIELNNALLLSYRSYNYNMEEFEKLFNTHFINQNIKIFVDYCAQFAKEKDPEKALSYIINQL